MERYIVTVNAADESRVYGICVPDDGVYAVAVGDPYSGTIRMAFDGLISDGQLVDLFGTLSLWIGTSQADLNFPVNLNVNSEDSVSVDQDQAALMVERLLSGDEVVFVGTRGSMTVCRVLDGATNTIQVSTDSAALSAAVWTVISDWSDSRLSDWADKTLDELFYKEV